VKPRSLRGQLIAGAVIWSIVLLAGAFAIAIAIVQHNPRMTLIVHNGLMALAGAVIVTAGFSVFRRVLSPFNLLRERLAAVRDGRSARLDGDYPSEVAPLVDDLNTLLEEREGRVARAVAKAGDLAHGLKTPLAILTQDIERADAAGQVELAASIRKQVERMRRQITSHLAQARATAAGTVKARSSVADATHGLVRTMERLYADRKLSVDVGVTPDAFVRVPVEDLEEMLGNLLDNACKWAKSRVHISAAIDGARVTIDVDDDGPGLEPVMRKEVLRRGVRADEAMPGSGLGLAIVRDLAEAYGGAVALLASPEGGIRSRLTLPA